jgi:hypothetical protein
VGALDIEELDRFGVPARVDTLPGVGFAGHVVHAVDCDSAVGVGDAAGWPLPRSMPRRSTGAGFGCGGFSARRGVPCLLRDDPPGQALMWAFGVIGLCSRRVRGVPRRRRPRHLSTPGKETLIHDIDKDCSRART